MREAVTVIASSALRELRRCASNAHRMRRVRELAAQRQLAREAVAQQRDLAARLLVDDPRARLDVGLAVVAHTRAPRALPPSSAARMFSRPATSCTSACSNTVPVEFVSVAQPARLIAIAALVQVRDVVGAPREAVREIADLHRARARLAGRELHGQARLREQLVGQPRELEPLRAARSSTAPRCRRRVCSTTPSPTATIVAAVRVTRPVAGFVRVIVTVSPIERSSSDRGVSRSKSKLLSASGRASVRDDRRLRQQRLDDALDHERHGAAGRSTVRVSVIEREIVAVDRHGDGVRARRE